MIKDNDGDIDEATFPDVTIETEIWMKKGNHVKPINRNSYTKVPVRKVNFINNKEKIQKQKTRKNAKEGNNQLQTTKAETAVKKKVKFDSRYINFRKANWKNVAKSSPNICAVQKELQSH